MIYLHLTYDIVSVNAALLGLLVAFVAIIKFKD